LEDYTVLDQPRQKVRDPPPPPQQTGHGKVPAKIGRWQSETGSGKNARPYLKKKAKIELGAWHKR
jgi:hypothetical protein